jgi:hypothetical protein
MILYIPISQKSKKLKLKIFSLGATPKEKDINKLKKRLSYWLGTYWIEFDFMYLKPKLVNNWPQVRDDTEIVAQRIKEAINDYINKKKMRYYGDINPYINDNEKEEKQEIKQNSDLFKDLKILNQKKY